MLRRGYWWPHSDADLYNLPMNLLDKSKAAVGRGQNGAAPDPAGAGKSPNIQKLPCTGKTKRIYR